jgi:4-hydroxy-tetrahydrodipicolinate synthase
VGRHPSAVIKGIKCALSCRGLCSDYMAEPLHHFRAAERERIAQVLPELEALVRDVEGIPAPAPAC